MDPFSFVKSLVGGLALRIQVASKPTKIGVHPTTSPCFYEFKLYNFPLQFALVLVISPKYYDPNVHNVSVSFHLEENEVKKLSSLSSPSCLGSSKPLLEVIYTRRQGSTCDMALGKLLGKFSDIIDLEGANEKAIIFHTNWVLVGKMVLKCI